MVKTLVDHFNKNGSPVMIGGDVKAYTIMGVDIGDEEVRFLILDPHYTGSDSNLKEICKRQWCSWFDPDKKFRNNCFYNLCLP